MQGQLSGCADNLVSVEHLSLCSVLQRFKTDAAGGQCKLLFTNVEAKRAL